MTSPQRARHDSIADGLPSPGETSRLIAFLQQHPHWSVFWDKRQCLWRAADFFIGLT
jgi:hypothetical protein